MKHCLPIFLLFLSVSAHGALNKWVDADGKVHYSDEAPPSNVKSQTVAIPAAASGVPAQKSIAEREAERKKALKTRDEAVQKAAQQQESELAKQKNCAGAKANLSTLESHAPVATYNDKGERSIMDDPARQQGIEEANKQISMYCN
jgi:outer membrane protein assembly factor BamA